MRRGRAEGIRRAASIVSSAGGVGVAGAWTSRSAGGAAERASPGIADGTKRARLAGAGRCRAVQLGGTPEVRMHADDSGGGIPGKSIQTGNPK